MRVFVVVVITAFSFSVGYISRGTELAPEIAGMADKAAKQETLIAELAQRPDAKVIASADIDFGAARSMFGNPLKRDAPAEKLVVEAVILEVHPAESRVQHPYTFACIKVQEQDGVWTGYANDGFRYLGFTKSFVATPSSDSPKFP